MRTSSPGSTTAYETIPEESTSYSVGFKLHDHNRCVQTALEQAQARCDAEGLRFTTARKRVLEMLLEEHRAMGAYEVLEKMQKEGLGAQPPAAYRALDFLVANGFAHRIESLNAFVARAHPGDGHVPAFLLCRSCGAVAEAAVDPTGSILETVATDAGFHVETTIVEAKGLCPSCQTVDTPSETG